MQKKTESMKENESQTEKQSPAREVEEEEV